MHDFDFIFISHYSEIEEVVLQLTQMGYSVCVLEKEDMTSSKMENHYTLYYDETAPLLSYFSKEEVLSKFLYLKQDNTFYYPKNSSSLFLKQFQNKLFKNTPKKYRLKKKGNKWQIQQPILDYKRLKIECLKTAESQGACLFNYTRVKEIKNTDNNLFELEVEDTISKETFSLKGKEVVQLYDDSSLCDKSSISPFKWQRESSFLTGFRIKKKPQKVIENLFFFVNGNKKCFLENHQQYCEVYWLTSLEHFEQELEKVIKQVNILISENLSVEDIEIKKHPHISLCKLYTQDSSLFKDIQNIKSNKMLMNILLRGKNKDSQDTANFTITSADFGIIDLSEHHLVELEERKYHESYQIQASLPFIRHLFKTYGAHIDKIIELAYDLYNEIEDKTMVFKQAELQYLKNNEWLKTEQDYSNRTIEQ